MTRSTRPPRSTRWMLSHPQLLHRRSGVTKMRSISRWRKRTSRFIFCELAHETEMERRDGGAERQFRGLRSR